jgi:endonuclease-3
VGSNPITLLSVVETLRRFYGRLPDPPADPFAFFVWEMLSFGTPPAKRDAAFGALKKIPALTPDAMWRAPQAKIDRALGLAGPYREQRLRALRAGVDRFRRSPTLSDVIQGPLPAARRALRAFPQLGEPGVRRLLFFAGEHPVFPVDGAVARVAVRLGYGRPSTDPRRRVRFVQAALRQELDGHVDDLRRTIVYLSHHGSTTCAERNPHCGICPLVHDCAWTTSRL